jgi:hypothetical protein
LINKTEYTQGNNQKYDGNFSHGVCFLVLTPDTTAGLKVEAKKNPAPGGIFSI